MASSIDARRPATFNHAAPIQWDPEAVRAARTLALQHACHDERGNCEASKVVDRARVYEEVLLR